MKQRVALLCISIILIASVSFGGSHGAPPGHKENVEFSVISTPAISGETLFAYFAPIDPMLTPSGENLPALHNVQNMLTTTTENNALVVSTVPILHYAGTILRKPSYRWLIKATSVRQYCTARSHIIRRPPAWLIA